jgi:hypothetical protein
LPDVCEKFEGGTLKIFEGIKYFGTWLQQKHGAWHVEVGLHESTTTVSLNKYQ